jgi:hypothetical protein
MFKLIYLLLKNRLKSTVPELKEIAWYFQQDKQKGGIKITPALFIEFKPSQMRSLSKGIQEGTVEFTVHLFIENVADGDKRIPENPQFGLSELADKVYVSFQNYSGFLSQLPTFENLANTENDFKIMNSIDRTSMATEHTLNTIMKSEQSFKTYAKDFTAVKDFTKVINGKLAILELTI